ncbi:lasso peptide biosynthesis B2 protein [Denitratimonas sp. CY0512]|uniref:lasso peptide biosynthesis B2 protein n=1 Tax=Denitratimonas sp. CY0512 TaxID=3131940 RepID=UPI00309F06EE
MKLLRRWRAIPPQERRALWPCAWRLVLVRSLLAGIGTVRTRALLARQRAGEAHITSPELWQHRSHALQRLSGRLPDTRCLARSFTLWWWMRRSGLAPNMKVGIRQAHPKTEGHAWVECDGHVFGETQEGTANYSLLHWQHMD